MDFPDPALKTATTPEAQKLYSEALKNFKKLHSPTLKRYQQMKTHLGLVIAIGAFYLLWNSSTPQLAISFIILVMFIFNAIEDIYLWRYQQKNRKQYAHQYIKTFGKIIQVLAYDKRLKHLKIEIEFFDLDDQSHHQILNISYPDFLLESVDVAPKNLEGQAIELCLTPNLAIVLQIRAYHENPDQLKILTHHFHKHPIWQRHENYLLHPSYFYPESMQSIHFIREEHAGHFKIFFQGLEHNFQVSSTSPSLEHIENYIFASYSDFFMKHEGLQPVEKEYRKLKFSNEPAHIELWKNPTTPISNQNIQNLSKQKIRLVLICGFLSLLIALFILFFVSALLGGALFLACFCGSLIYFEYVSLQSKCFQRCIPQL
jgi:hypothetical protein